MNLMFIYVLIYYIYIAVYSVRVTDICLWNRLNLKNLSCDNDIN